MKQILILFCAIFFTLNLSAQTIPKNVVVIQHTSYVTYFDTIKHYPVYVKWELTSSMLTCSTKIKRTNNFAPDPKLEKQTNLESYYAHSKYDRGHNMDALDNECNNTEENECFYFSNMTPQLPALNRGNWKELESYSRNLALKDGDIIIYCGSFGHVDDLGIVSVPQFCWKVIKDKKDGHVEAYLMPNSNDVNNFPIEHYKIDLIALEKQTNIIIN